MFESAEVLHHTSIATCLMREANVSLLSTDNEMRCIRISVIHLKKKVFD